MTKRASPSTSDGDDDDVAATAAAPHKRQRVRLAADDGGEVEGEVAAEQEAAAVVVAPMFTPVHRSWDEFEQSLKDYAQATYQLYVVRTTTSVQRRNQRIADNASSSVTPSSATGGGLETLQHEVEEDGDSSSLRDAPSSSVASLELSTASDRQQQQLIPESYRWYSKTLMCTHGWKSRQRGGGKRALAMARSTSCPAKMCVTLQHRGAGTEGWQVVLTRHVRAHNHPLSKELFQHYSENRRIYDPELLLVSSGAEALASDSPRARDTPHSRSGLSHLLVDVDAQHAALEYEHPGGLMAEPVVDSEIVADDAASAPAGDHHGVFVAQRVDEKAHASWEHFHKYVAEYALASKQSFRARSTVSAAAKNLKTETLAIKAGRSAEDITRLMVPTNERWYSKMLICSHGWKRKSRSKAPRVRAEDDNGGVENSCPALLMARLQRDGDDNWHVVINRQVVEHNHPLGAGVNSTSAAASSVFDLQRPASGSEPGSSNHSVLHYFGADVGGDLSDTGGHDFEADDDDDGDAPHHVAAPHPQREVMVRAPKFETVHTSWEAFHARLHEYSDATFQLYRTRTTSSVHGRNLKIPDVRRSASAEGESSASRSDTRAIPSEWKWYSKTLTCTHGWKERRRGTGKRTVQVFRSTACPAKICATVQFVEAADLANAGDDGSENERGEWRVVVTKHVADHNHNLSKALHQHYSENRRIYDPDLLTIDESNDAAVVKPKKHHSFLLSSEDHAATPRGAPTDRVAEGSAGVEDAAVATSTEAAQQLPTSVLHTFALMSVEPSLALGLAASSSVHTSESASSETTDSGSTTAAVSGGATASQHGLSQMASFAAGAFPSISASSTMFSAVSGSHQTPSAYLYQPHQFFAVDHPSAALGFAVPHFATAQTSISTSSAISAGAGSTSTETSLSGGGSLLSRCRVHSAGLQLAHLRADASGAGQCTCVRAVGIASSANPSSTRSRAPANLAADPTAFQSSIARLQVHMQTTAATSSSSRVQRDDGNDVAEPTPDTGDAAGEDEAAGSAVVWVPAQDPEIVRLTSSSGTTFWRAPRIQRVHPSWELFQEHLDAYSVATFQLFRVRTTSSISARNARIAQQSTDRREVPTPVGSADSASSVTPPQLVPESFQWYSKTFVCTHGWKERRRGSGQRVSHSLRSTACPAKLCVTLQRAVHDADKWHVVVTRQGTDHNHELSAQAYQQYSEVRRIKDSTLLERAEELWKKGQSRRKVFEFLKEHAANAILMKDVHNLVQRWQQQHSASRRSSSRSVLEEGASAARDPTAETEAGDEVNDSEGVSARFERHREEEI